MKIFHAGSNVRTFACSLACCLRKAYTRKARLAVVRCSTIVLLPSYIHEFSGQWLLAGCRTVEL
jgi:hypothetical protein